MGRHAPGGPRRLDAEAGRRDSRFAGRAGGAREPGLGKTRLRHPPPGSSGGAGYSDLLRRHGRQDQRPGHSDSQRCADLHHSRTAGRGRRHHSVEFSPDDRHVEDRAGPGLRLHRRIEAGGDHALERAQDRRAGASSGVPRRRAQCRSRLRQDRGAGARRSSGRRQGDLHRLAGRGPPDPARRRREPEARDARAGRQVRQHHLSRRRP